MTGASERVVHSALQFEHTLAVRYHKPPLPQGLLKIEVQILGWTSMFFYFLGEFSYIGN